MQPSHANVSDPVWVYILAFGVIIGSAFAASCSKLPHEFFGYGTSMRLTTICHVWKPETCTRFGHEPGCQRTMMFNHPMAERHLDNHDDDYLGECK